MSLNQFKLEIYTMKKHWKYSKHFAERFIERFYGDKKKLSNITKFFNRNVLQCVFRCHVYGFTQRVTIGQYKVCYKWDDQDKMIIITTVY